MLLKGAVIPVCETDSVNVNFLHSELIFKSLFSPLKTGTCGLGKSQSERVILRYHFSWDFDLGDSSRLMVFYTRK